MWREGRLVRMERGGRLPDRCVMCNRPAAAWRLARKFYWSPRWWRIAAGSAVVLCLAGSPVVPVLAVLFWPLLLVLAIANAFLRKRLPLDLGLCPLHRRVRAAMIGVSLLALTATIAAIFLYLAMQADPPPMLFWAPVALTLLLALVQVFVRVPSVSLRGLDAEHAWLAGTGRAFREALPELPR